MLVLLDIKKPFNLIGYVTSFMINLSPFYNVKHSIVPSKVWSRQDKECHLYVGGFKSALNISFLKNHSVGLIVNAAYLLDRLYPPKTKIYQEFERRRNSKDLEHVEEMFVNWLDDPKQTIKSSILKNVLSKINECIFVKGKKIFMRMASGILGIII